MNELPAAYAQYLADNPRDVDTVRPILLQSVADGTLGVRVVLGVSGHQAHLDEAVPYGEILEAID
ncbi:MAG: hypothetical protein ACHP7K_12445 [Actinomycetales bacterium]|jgi:hypothetical protein